MNEPKKISYRSLTEKMSDEKLKNIIAGCGGSGSVEVAHITFLVRKTENIEKR